ncbi:MAG: hypothetical protein JWP02_453 [Acidimicrobiales bacterium]|nr:hypothetical protein [Acidimicrobiales bacterium]
MTDPGRIVVLGVMGQSPFAGVGWQVLHYLEGFRRLGWDVVYVEDTGAWPYDPVANTVSADCSYALSHLGTLLARCGLEDSWAYRNAAEGGAVYGPAADAGTFTELFARADVLVNLTGATVLRDEHLAVPVRLYLETDPVLPQVEVAEGRAFTTDLLSAHTHLATFGENLGAPDCGVPVTPGFDYIPTRQPVVCDWWVTPGVPGARYTTIGSWRQDGKDLEWQGETYTWSKHVEFLKILDLPSRLSKSVDLALACDDADDLALLRSHGWGVVEAVPLSLDLDVYRRYIATSRGEITVAKDQNVRLRSGWFSDRSACYLASGRPVITQDTGFGNVLPTGQGLFAFRDADDIVAAVDAIESDVDKHRRAAAEIAQECFRAEHVLTELLARMGV